MVNGYWDHAAKFTRWQHPAMGRGLLTPNERRIKQNDRTAVEKK